MKYIDADLLKKEIDHRIDILADVSIKCAKNDDMEMHNYYHGKAISLEELLHFIDSLQQEEPEVGKKTFDDYLKASPSERRKMNMTEILGEEKLAETKKQMDQSEVDLAADIEMEWNSFNKHLVKYEEGSEDVVWLNWNSFNEIARYFFELGQRTKYQQDREEFAKLKAKEWMNGYDEGYAKGLTEKQSQIDWESEIEEYWIASGWNMAISLAKFKVIARYFIGLALNVSKEDEK